MSVTTVFHQVLQHLDTLTVNELSQLHVLLVIRLGSWFTPPVPHASQKAPYRVPMTATSRRCGGGSSSSSGRRPTGQVGQDLSQQTSIFADDPSYIAMKHARKDTIAAMKAEVCKFWQLSDTSLIGRNLLTRARFDLLKQSYRKRILRQRSQLLPDLDHAFINSELAYMNDEQVAAMRNTALSQCAKLIARCGGVAACRLRNDDCPRYVELSIVTFRLTENEFLNSLNAICPDMHRVNCTSLCSNC